MLWDKGLLMYCNYNYSFLNIFMLHYIIGYFNIYDVYL